MLVIDVTSKEYFLPNDSALAQADFLALLHTPGDTYIDCYGLSLPSLVDEIIAADANHVKIDISCDHLQSTGMSVKPVLQKILAAFNESGTGSSITITSAGDALSQTTEIYHKKCMIVKALDGGEDYCVEGSTNFTSPAWFEANTLRIFRSSAWASVALQYHNENKAWALKTHPEWQLGYVSTPKESAIMNPLNTEQKFEDALAAANLLYNDRVINAYDVAAIIYKLNLSAQEQNILFIAQTPPFVDPLTTEED